MGRILILGASGFIGNAIYKELCSYFDTYGTYASGKIYSDNQHYFHFNMEQDNIISLLNELKPRIIISALRGDFAVQTVIHSQIIDYISQHRCRLIYLSSANVFDAFSNFPSYEYDKTLSESIYGKLKIRTESKLLRLPESKYVIARLPMVFGNTSPRVREIKSALKSRTPIEVFPNLIMNVTADFLITRQIHYIINRNKKGIYHLGSHNLIHHEEFIEMLVERITPEKPVYKKVYTSNFDRYLAVLPKDHKLPGYLQFGYEDVLDLISV